MRPLCTALVLLAACAAAPPRPSMAFGDEAGPERLEGEGPRVVKLQRLWMLTAGAKQSSPKGAPMPAPLVEAWIELLDVLDTSLDRLTLAEVVQTRQRLERALEAAGEQFGDLPYGLAERIPSALAAISARLGALSERTHRADPRHFLWPTQPVVVNSPWGDRMHPIHGEVRFHAGVDLGAEKAQSIHAAGAGTVIFSGWNGAHGKQIELQHDSHLTTRYSHLMTLLVEVGHQVKRGEVIGLAGQTGGATGPHLHFELRADGESIDPETVLPAPPLEAQTAEVLR